MWRFDMTKNVTMAFDEEKLARLRVLAAQQRTTVNGLFRKHVDYLLDGDERRQKAREWMRQKAHENMENDAKLAAARARGEVVEEETWRWSREETYAERQWPKGE
jgi:hypothetical protein